MFSYQNVIDGNGINISLTGMLIVFSGLTLISLYIYFLPKILDVFEKKSLDVVKGDSETPEAAEKISGSEDKTEIPVNNEADELEARDIASVIGMVLHLELERSQLIDDQRITIIRDEYHGPVWGISKKLRVTPFRRS